MTDTRLDAFRWAGRSRNDGASRLNVMSGAFGDQGIFGMNSVLFGDKSGACGKSHVKNVFANSDSFSDHYFLSRAIVKEGIRWFGEGGCKSASSSNDCETKRNEHGSNHVLGALVDETQR